MGNNKKIPPKNGGIFYLVDLGGIEPPSVQCECTVLPLDYRPFCKLFYYKNYLIKIKNLYSSTTYWTFRRAVC